MLKRAKYDDEVAGIKAVGGCALVAVKDAEPWLQAAITVRFNELFRSGGGEEPDLVPDLALS